MCFSTTTPSTQTPTCRDIFLIPFFGNSLATRLVCAEEAHQVLVLGDFRAAQRVLLRLPLASSASKTTTSRADDEPALHVWVVNMHLDHDHPDRRAAQGEAVVSWMEDAKGRCDAIVLCGDLNASPPEPLHALLRQRGYRSAHTMVHGNEPQVCCMCIVVGKQEVEIAVVISKTTRLVVRHTGHMAVGHRGPACRRGPL